MHASLSRYAHLRGCNYTPAGALTGVAMWRDYDPAQVERELDIGVRLRLNSLRVFLSYPVWEHDPAAFRGRLLHLVRAGHDRGMTTMPALFDSCFTLHTPQHDSPDPTWLPNPGIERIGTDWWARLDDYCRDLADTLGAEPGLEMWDACNEPMANVWTMGATADEYAERRPQMEAFVRHVCEFMRSLDAGPVTVGSQDAEHVAQFQDDVDVCSYHHYARTRSEARIALARAIELADGKQLLLSEFGCLARTNPYDMSIEVYDEAGLGWYLWELMIGGSPWSMITGLVYPDGTVRDAAAIAALHGFHRKRDGDGVAAIPDAEGAVRGALRDADAFLSSGEGAGREIAERMANLLEAACDDVPSARALNDDDVPGAVRDIAALLQPYSLEP